MKTLRLIRRTLLSLLLGTALVLAVPVADNRAASYAQAVNFGFFYSTLSPHGRWVTVDAYGDVWIPARAPVGWQPYTVGRWAYTDYGWTWVSLDPWGDIPYHYGTWTHIRHHGWVWVPGYVWAPAWVTWSYSDAYIGWAPIPPTLVITSWGYAGPPVVVERDHYVFVPVHRFVNVDVTTVRVAIRRNITIIRETRNVTNFKVVNGTVRSTAVPVTHVERAAHTRIQRTDINVVRATPTRIEAGGGRQGDRILVAGPRERNVARLEERSNRSDREGRPRAPDGISPRPGSNRGSSEERVVSPPERKGGAIEEKRDQRVREGQGRRPDVGSPRPGTDRGSPEARVVAPPEKKGGRFEERSKQHERPSEPPRVHSRQPPTKEQHSQSRKDKGEKSQEHRKELPPS